MAAAFHPGNSPVQRRIDAYVLALSWLAGLICGFLVSLGAGSSLSSMMRRAAVGSVSIVSLVGSALFPFLISAFAVLLSRSALLLVCFGKAFLFSFTAAGILRAFGGAGWLACRLVMFSDFALLPLLYFFWLRLLSGRARRLGTAAVFALAMLIVSAHYRIISPLWASLIGKL
ncbi:MAG: hypothetical protein Q4F17_02605 [Eubacteriales bacterium]|nr:hypothetical protein [Eubacteriales bacterium]